MNLSTKPTGYIYIITCEGTNRIKIGYSGNPEKRRKELATGAPGVLAIARTWTAYQSDEKQIHRIIERAGHARCLEWFEIGVEAASEIITDYLRRSDVNVIPASDLVPLRTPFICQVEQLTDRGVLAFLPRLDKAIDYVREQNGKCLETRLVKKRISQMLTAQQVWETALLEIGFAMKGIMSNENSYLRAIGQAIFQKFSALGHQAIEDIIANGTSDRRVSAPKPRQVEPCLALPNN